MVDENEIEAQIQTMLDEIANNCDRLDLMVNKEPPSRRTTAKIRVDQLKYDCQHLQAALRNVQHRRYCYALIFNILKALYNFAKVQV